MIGSVERRGAFASTVDGIEARRPPPCPRQTELVVTSVLIPKRRAQLDAMPELLQEIGVKRWVVTALQKVGKGPPRRPRRRPGKNPCRPPHPPRPRRSRRHRLQGRRRVRWAGQRRRAGRVRKEPHSTLIESRRRLPPRPRRPLLQGSRHFEAADGPDSALGPEDPGRRRLSSHPVASPHA